MLELTPQLFWPPVVLIVLKWMFSLCVPVFNIRIYWSADGFMLKCWTVYPPIEAKSNILYSIMQQHFHMNYKNISLYYILRCERIFNFVFYFLKFTWKNSFYVFKKFFVHVNFLISLSIFHDYMAIPASWLCYMIFSEYLCM